eukprot:4141336-Karenia_brevis.AAC.1
MQYMTAHDPMGLMYADGSQCVEKASKNMNVTSQASEPGAPHSNSVAESNVEDYSQGAQNNVPPRWIAVLPVDLCRPNA